jgi:hypothetical protein
LMSVRVGCQQMLQSIEREEEVKKQDADSVACRYVLVS